jgi:hypothetical protein
VRQQKPTVTCARTARKTVTETTTGSPGAQSSDRPDTREVNARTLPEGVQHRTEATGRLDPATLEDPDVRRTILEAIADTKAGRRPTW